MMMSKIKKERKVYWTLDRIPMTGNTLETNTALCQLAPEFRDIGEHAQV